MTDSSYQSIAQAYVDGIQVLFSPSGEPAGERGGFGPRSFEDLASQAERLVPLSTELIGAARSRLTDGDPGVRDLASTQLLAKALMDLEVGNYLLQAATDQSVDIQWATADRSERSSFTQSATQGYLQILLGVVDDPDVEISRGGETPSDVPSAQVMLIDTITDTLDLVSERASKTGQSALSGLLGIGISEVGKAVGIVGLDLAQTLGKADQVTRLFSLVREFALSAYESIISLLGESVAQTAARQLLEWVESLQEGEQIGKVLEKLYRTQDTQQDLTEMVKKSEVELETLTTTIDRVDTLEVSYRKKVELADTILHKLKFLAALPAAVVPQGKVLLAAVYLVLGGYVIFAGADYVDAKHLNFLNRVPGVRQVVVNQLNGDRDE